MQHQGSDTLTLRSAIKPQLMSSILMKGTVLASFGAGSLLYAGIFLPLETLKVWGIPLFIFSFTLITFGLLPYRRITYLEKNPHKIEIGNKSFLFAQHGKPSFTVPTISVKKITYIDRGNDYGIGVTLKTPVSQKIYVHDQSFNMEKYQGMSRSKYGCDLYLPYFSERSFERMKRS